MIKQTLIIMMAIMFIASVSALYSGENMQLSSGMTQVTYWSLTGNSSFVNITNSSDSFHIYVAEDAEQDSYSIYMEGYKNEEERVISSGGGSMTYVLPNGSLTYKKPVIVNKTIDINNIPQAEKPYAQPIDKTPVVNKDGMTNTQKIILAGMFIFAFMIILYFAVRKF